MYNDRGKNIILEKIRGVFVKIQGLSCSLKFWIYFPIEKRRRIDPWHGGLCPQHRFMGPLSFIKHGPIICRSAS
jgi:hypothetical protein